MSSDGDHVTFRVIDTRRCAESNVGIHNSSYLDKLYLRIKMTDYLQYVLPNHTDVVQLDCRSAVEGLTPKEKLYVHYLTRASWYGGLIVMFQTSSESPGIFLLLHKLYSCQSLKSLESLAMEIGFTDRSWQAILVYSAGVFTNMGNYKSFGDTKFIPDVPAEQLKALIQKSEAYKTNPELMQDLWERVGEEMYDLDDRKKQLGLGHKGISTYYSSNCGMRDATYGQEFLNSKDINPYNTRLFKSTDVETGQRVYEVRLASTLTDRGDDEVSKVLGPHQFTPAGKERPIQFLVTRGDYSPLLKKVVENLEKAKEYVANDFQRNMLHHYIESFTTGSIQSHKDGSREWIKDKGPVVESYIGFIESYRDPLGSKGEFEAFVAVVNKEISKKFTRLVEEATHFLSMLPWPTEYEKDTFLRPDFTSLDVVTFAGSGIPAGVNIPNYDEIRQNEGFKNVSMGNVLTSGYKESIITFILEQDKALYAKLQLPSWAVQVGLHELLGHGSGKLFQKKASGELNFDLENTLHPLTGEKVTTWYEANESFYAKFPVFGSSYEECRAECVGLYLCLSSEVLRIFGHDDDEADDIIYINWLIMARAGLLALEYYSPDKRTWRQAHMQARYVILRVLLEAGDDLVKITRFTADDGEPDMYVQMDRSKINTVGKPAIGKFLQKLQVYKTTADVAGAKAMYDHYSHVGDEEEPHFLTLRNIALSRKQPRKFLVQANTRLQDGEVVLEQYENSTGGVIQSVIDRYAVGDVDEIVLDLWQADTKHHCYRTRYSSECHD